MSDLTNDERAELEALRAQAASAPQRGKLSCKVSVKGAVSIYGMGRFPVTLYKEQWLKLDAFMGELKAFIEAHDSELTTKNKPE